MDKMLISAAHQHGEVRVALINENNRLYDLDIESTAEIKKKGNIYKATVTRIEPSLDAVFVNYGSKRQGFLPLKEINPEYFKRPYNPESDVKPSITALIREGQELLVQIDKEERGTKGAALTTFITLAGCYLVLMPNSPNAGGISRRIEGEERDEMRENLNALKIEDNMGLIIRTAGVGKGIDDLQTDLNMLIHQWHSILKAYKEQNAPCLIHQEGDVITRAIRDNLKKSIGEIIIDEHVAYIKAKQYIELIKPDFLPNLKLYKHQIPLFNFYQVESQIEMAYQRIVPLQSGGSLVIDRTEALVSIDINSAKATGGSDIETTAFNTNLEAAEEIARQLRLRDLGGLVVIDFIDMNQSKNQREVENRLKEAVKADRARIQLGRISRFGLLEMSRQRIRLSLGENVQEVCPRCEGRGTVRNVYSQTLSIIRLIEEEALKEKTVELQVQLPVEMATYMVNEKRDFVLSIEKHHNVRVFVIANPYLHVPQYKITRVREENVKTTKPSYTLIEQPELELVAGDRGIHVQEEPAVKAMNLHNLPLSSKEPGFLKRLWFNLFGREQESNSKEEIVTEGQEETTNASTENVKSSSHHSYQKRRRSSHGSRNSKYNSHRSSSHTSSHSRSSNRKKSSSGVRSPETQNIPEVNLPQQKTPPQKKRTPSDASKEHEVSEE